MNKQTQYNASDLLGVLIRFVSMDNQTCKQVQDLIQKMHKNEVHANELDEQLNALEQSLREIKESIKIEAQNIKYNNGKQIETSTFFKDSGIQCHNPRLRKVSKNVNFTVSFNSKDEAQKGINFLKQNFKHDIVDFTDKSKAFIEKEENNKTNCSSFFNQILAEYLHQNEIQKPPLSQQGEVIEQEKSVNSKRDLEKLRDSEEIIVVDVDLQESPRKQQKLEIFDMNQVNQEQINEEKTEEKSGNLVSTENQDMIDVEKQVQHQPEEFVQVQTEVQEEAQPQKQAEEQSTQHVEKNVNNQDPQENKNNVSELPQQQQVVENNQMEEESPLYKELTDDEEEEVVVEIVPSETNYQGNIVQEVNCYTNDTNPLKLGLQENDDNVQLSLIQDKTVELTSNNQIESSPLDEDVDKIFIQQHETLNKEGEETNENKLNLEILNVQQFAQIEVNEIKCDAASDIIILPEIDQNDGKGCQTKQNGKTTKLNDQNNQESTKDGVKNKPAKNDHTHKDRSSKNQQQDKNKKKSTSQRKSPEKSPSKVDKKKGIKKEKKETKHQDKNTKKPAKKH